MTTIRNLTIKPIKVPLPGGKSLRLGPKADGLVREGAEKHGAVIRMVEAGTIEVLTGSSHGHGPAQKR
ncbi:MAG: hypothetical protein KDA24_18260 [Deltaproteobacteria bacterium]|nr:hypothetical protein [Deltaproteobacteria bacterium]